MPDFLNIDEYRKLIACSPNEIQINHLGEYIDIEVTPSRMVVQSLIYRICSLIFPNLRSLDWKSSIAS